MSGGRALVGYTGFVGGSLTRQAGFDAYFHRANVHEMRGRSFDLLVCCAAPAAKWLANRHPAEDWANLSALIEDLRQVRAGRAALISTVDVYPHPVGVDESTPIDPDSNHAYGRHRRHLESFVSGHFPSASLIRLPALFGTGLKKNLVFDLLAGRTEQFTHPDSTFQFYDLELLWSDVTSILDAGLPVVNIATEPVTARFLASTVFDVHLDDVPSCPAPVAYDVRSIHSQRWGRDDGYLYSRGEMLERLRAFVNQERCRP
jgi:hypothetical protein